MSINVIETMDQCVISILSQQLVSIIQLVDVILFVCSFFLLTLTAGGHVTCILLNLTYIK